MMDVQIELIQGPMKDTRITMNQVYLHTDPKSLHVSFAYPNERL